MPPGAAALGRRDVLNGKLQRYATSAIALAAMLCLVPPAFPEAMVQYFNTSWRELIRKVPELAEAAFPLDHLGNARLVRGCRRFDQEHYARRHYLATDAQTGDGVGGKNGVGLNVLGYRDLGDFR